MADVEVGKYGTTFTGAGIDVFRMTTLLVHLRSEIRGFKLTRHSAYSIIKSEWGLKGNKQSVCDQFEKIVAEAKAKLSVVAVD